MDPMIKNSFFTILIYWNDNRIHLGLTKKLIFFIWFPPPNISSVQINCQCYIMVLNCNSLRKIMIILTCSMVWRKLNQAWLSSSSISKLRFSSIIMLPSYSSIKSPFWLDYSADSSVAGFFLNPKSVRLQLQEIFFAFGVFFSRLKIQSERKI